MLGGEGNPLRMGVLGDKSPPLPLSIEVRGTDRSNLSPSSAERITRASRLQVGWGVEQGQVWWIGIVGVGFRLVSYAFSRRYSSVDASLWGKKKK